jgi:hypothetical protein
MVGALREEEEVAAEDDVDEEIETRNCVSNSISFHDCCFYSEINDTALTLYYKMK